MARDLSDTVNTRRVASCVRVGRGPQPWDRASRLSGVHGMRYDDPESEFGVRYGALTEEAALVEKLAQFQRDPARLEKGLLAKGWLVKQCYGLASFDKPLIDVARTVTLATLARELHGQARSHGLPAINSGTIRLEAPRGLTQAISRFFWERYRDTTSGLCYGSKHGDDLVCVAVWDHIDLHDLRSEPIDIDSPALARAMDLLNLEFD